MVTNNQTGFPIALEDQARADRLSEEWLKVEQALDEAGINQTIVFFGSARTQQQSNSINSDLATSTNQNPMHYCYESARNLARKVGEYLIQADDHSTKLITGGGPGIMEAANRGATDAGQSSIGLNIIIPCEQTPNPYVSQSFSFQFHYFSLRKMHFLKRAKAIIAFPGGFGTLDELMEALTLIQTKKIKAVPIVLFDSQFWRRLIDFEFWVERELIDREDLALFTITDSIDEAFELITKCFNDVD